MKIKLLCLILILALLFSACGGEPQAPAIVGPTVIDGAGRELAIPQDQENLTIASVYAVSVPFIKALGLTPQVKAINCKSRFWTDADEYLGQAGSVGRGVVDLEALAGFAPSVLIHRSNDSDTLEAVSKLDVEVLCISAEDMDGVYATLRLMGDYFGKEDRAEEVVAWMDGKFTLIADIVETIPEADRPTAVVLGSELGRVAGGDMLQSWMIEQAGGVSVSAAVENNDNWATVGVETIFEWDPEFIFCTSSSALDYQLSDITEGDEWSAVRAVATGQVYALPAKIDTWDMPGVASVLAIMYMLNQMHPDYFTTEQLAEQIAEYYTFMFGRTFDSDYLGYSLE